LKKFEAIVIGGSAGSFKPLCQLLSAIPPDFQTPIILCLHRLKTIPTGFAEVLNSVSAIKVIEPFDKQEIQKGNIYLAPSNYHLYIESNLTFSLSTEELINFSRPSIDITLESAAKIYKEKLLGIIYSGANTDGVNGMKKIQNNNGFTIAQNPDESQVNTMPLGAIKKKCIKLVLKSEEIVEYVLESCD
jgi:two-component system, chemotaxis family, protein-glutamate methylesterase/glutaminase